MTKRGWWHALRDAAQGVSRPRPHRQRRGAHLLLGALALPVPDRAGLAARRPRLRGLDRRPAADRRRPRLGLGGRHGPAGDREHRRELGRRRPRTGDRHRGRAVVGLGYIGAFIRCSNEIYDVEEDRPFWKLRPVQLLMTLVMTLIVAFVLIALVLTGPLAQAIGDEIGLGDTALTDLLDRQVAAAVLRSSSSSSGSSIASRPTPSTRPALDPARRACWRRRSGSSPRPASASTSPTSAPTRAPTGASPAAIVFLIWLWLTNLAIVFGAQFAAELERTGQAARTLHPARGVRALRRRGEGRLSAARPVR